MSVASEITRLQNAKASLKASINAKTDSSHQIANETIDNYANFVDSIETGGSPNLQSKSVTIQNNGTTNVTADSGYDGLSSVNVITNINKDFTGNYDSEGLTTIGYPASAITFYQKNGLFWDSNLDSEFQLNANELAGDTSNKTRYVPYNNNLTTYNGYSRLLTIAHDKYSLTSYEKFFYMCGSIRAIDVENLIDIISTTTSLKQMFANCMQLRKIKFGKTTNTSIEGVTTTHTMFGSCYSVVEIDTSKLNSRNAYTNITDMTQMYYYCYSLIKADVTKFKTNKLTNMTGMFRNCYNLKEVNMSTISYNTNLGLNVANAFNGCYALEKIDLRAMDFGVGNVSNYSTMLTDVPTNCLIIVKNATAKSWFATNLPDYTNVKTPSEL